MNNMEIQYIQLEENQTSQIKTLWKEGFGESDYFLDFYFGKWFDCRTALAAFSKGEIKASLQCQPHSLNFLGREIPAAYMLGIVTSPKCRKQGLMSGLINKSLKSQRQDGVLVSTLIPAENYLFDIYAKYGFAPVFFMGEETAYSIETSGGEIFTFTHNAPPTEKQAQSLYSFYTDAYKALDCSLLKSRRDFDFLIAEFTSIEGGIVAVTAGNSYTACGFLHKNGFVKELLYKDDDSRNKLISHILRRLGKKELTVKGPFSAGQRPFAMARAVNVPGIMALSNKPLDLCVHDPLIPENNGYFQWKNGAVTQNSSDSPLTLTISQFTRLAFMYNFDVGNYKAEKASLYPYTNMLLND